MGTSLQQGLETDSKLVCITLNKPCLLQSGPLWWSHWGRNLGTTLKKDFSIMCPQAKEIIRKCSTFALYNQSVLPAEVTQSVFKGMKSGR